MRELVSVVFRDSGGKEVELTPAAQSGTGPITITIPDVVDSADTVVVADAAQTLNSKTLTSPVINTTVSGTALETDLSLSAAANKLPTAAAAKAYADSVAAAQDDASEITYTPTVPADWDVTPTEVESALDELAQRVDDDETALTTHESDTSTHGVTEIVGRVETQTLTNKKLEDSTTTIVDQLDNTKQLRFEASGITTGTTRVLTSPDASGTIATESYADTAASDAVTTHDVADEHVAHSGVSVVAATNPGLTAANNDLSSNIGLELDINGLTVESTLDGANDYIPFWDFDGTGNKLRKVLVGNIGGGGGGGSGTGLNYIGNPSAQTDTTGWGTTGAATVTRTDTASELPRSTATDSGLKIDLGSAADTVYYNFEIGEAERASVLTLKFAQQVESGYAAGDWKVTLDSYTSSANRDADTSPTSITIVDPGIPATAGEFSRTFVSDANQYYRLSFERVAGSTHIVVSDVQVTRETPKSTAIVTGWESYVPTNVQGLTTDGTTSTGTWTNLEYRRVGSSLEIRGYFTTGTVTASEIQIGLPENLTIGGNAGAATSLAGELLLDTTQGLRQYQLLATLGDTYLNLSRGAEGGSSNITTPVTGSTFGGTGLRATILATIPIAEWEGSGTTNLSAARVEYASNSGNNTVAGSSDTTSFDYGTDGNPIGSINSTTSSSNTRRRVQFTTEIQPTDMLILEIDGGTSGARWTPVATDNSIDDYKQQGNFTYGMGIEQFSSTEINVVFGNGGRLTTNGTYSAAGGAWSATAAWRWRVRKVSPEAPAGIQLATTSTPGLHDIKAAAGYKSSNTTGLTSGNDTIVIFDTEEFDYGSIYDNTTGELNLPAGIWKIHANVRVDAATSNALLRAELRLYKDTVLFKYGTEFQTETGVVDNTRVSQSWVVESDGTNVFDIRAVATTISGTWSILNLSSITYFSCVKVG